MIRKRHIDRTTLMGNRGLTPEGETLAEEIYARGLALMALSDHLTISEAIDIAAAQIGIVSSAPRPEGPQEALSGP